MKPVIASSRGPSGEAASSSACTRNQVTTAAPKAHAGAEHHRPAAALVRAEEARGDRREDQDRLEPLAEDDDRRVDDDRAVALRRGTSVGSTGPVCAVAIR